MNGFTENKVDNSDQGNNEGIKTLYVIDPKIPLSFQVNAGVDMIEKKKIINGDFHRARRNIVIIANNKTHIPDIRKFPIKLNSEDIIVRFNKGLYPKDDTCFDNPNNLIVMFREHAVGISGIRSADGKIESKRLRHAKEYYLVGGGLQPDLVKLIEKKNNIKLNLLHTEVVKKTYGLEKTPSSGFVALIHFMIQMPEDRIILYGFTWEGWSGHNFKKERKIAKDLEAEGRLLIVPYVGS